MRILVINLGSSSLKFSVFDMSSNALCFQSELERVSSIDLALAQMPAILKGQKFQAIAHRIAHGGEKFQNSCLITDDVIADIEACIPLAPLHNPPILSAIKFASKTWGLPQVAVFDTAFHQTMPLRATTYAVPQEWRDAGFKRYGFHGISHRYIMGRTAQELGIAESELRIISCHLGSGASVCAIAYGQSIDTSMGMTPLEGLVMGSRSGDVDPGMFSYIHSTLGLSFADIEHALYCDSGLLALSEISDDMRDIEKSYNAKARLLICTPK